MFLKILRCLLATLTMDHRLELYEEIDKEWKIICDITEIIKGNNNSTKAESKSEEKNPKKKQKSKKRQSKRHSGAKRKRDSSDEDYEPDKDERSEYLNSVQRDVGISDSFAFDALAETIYRMAPVGMKCYCLYIIFFKVFQFCELQ